MSGAVNVTGWTTEEIDADWEAEIWAAEKRADRLNKEELAMIPTVDIRARLKDGSALSWTLTDFDGKPAIYGARHWSTCGHGVFECKAHLSTEVLGGAVSIVDGQPVIDWGEHEPPAPHQAAMIAALGEWAAEQAEAVSA